MIAGLHAERELWGMREGSVTAVQMLLSLENALGLQWQWVYLAGAHWNCRNAIRICIVFIDFSLVL